MCCCPLVEKRRTLPKSSARATWNWRLQNRRAWARTAILNIAAMGYFSSDRAILEYAEKIWGLESVAVKTPGGS